MNLPLKYIYREKFHQYFVIFVVVSQCCWLFIQVFALSHTWQGFVLFAHQEYIFVSPLETRMKQLNNEALHIIKHGVHIKIFLLQSACQILSGESASAISEVRIVCQNVIWLIFLSPLLSCFVLMSLCLHIESWNLMDYESLMKKIIEAMFFVPDCSIQYPGGINLERKNWGCNWSGPFPSTFMTLESFLIHSPPSPPSLSLSPSPSLPLLFNKKHKHMSDNELCHCSGCFSQKLLLPIHYLGQNKIVASHPLLWLMAIRSASILIYSIVTGLVWHFI